MIRSHDPFWKLVGNYLYETRTKTALAAIAMVCMTSTSLFRPWPLKVIFDYILLHQPLPSWMEFCAPYFEQERTWSIVVLSMTIVVIAGLQGVFAYMETFHTARIGSELAQRLQVSLFGHLQRLSLSYHDQNRLGTVMTRISGDTSAIQSFVSDSVLTLGSHGLTMVGTFLIMLIMNWQMALVVLASFPILFGNIYFLHRRAMMAQRRHRKKEDQIASRVTEVISNVRLVQALGRQSYEEDRFDGETKEFLRESLRHAMIDSSAARAVEVTTAFGTCAVVLFGSFQVLKGNMTPGSILVFSSYLHGLYRPIRRMVKLIVRFSRVQVAVERISEVLSLEQDIRDRPHARPAQSIRGDIHFDNVSFRYSNEDREVLRNLSFAIRAGQQIAVVGTSGAGKSTLIGLILRLYDPQQGSISIDGVDLRDYQVESLRHQIGVVLQDSILSGATIYDNIAYGNLTATRDQVIAAAKRASAHDFIETLEHGYETIIGERGARLSGGQQRRIAIARALVRDAPILILDEPMTGLDVQSERSVRNALAELMQHRTCITITHDLQAAAEADFVVCLDQGTITEIGPPEQLLASNGKFSELYHQERQSEPKWLQSHPVAAQPS